MMFWVLLVLTSVVSLGQSDPIHNLNADICTDIDIEARKEILLEIVTKINETVKSQRALITGCEVKINTTIDDCNACRADLCTPSIPIEQAVFLWIATGVNVPIVLAGTVIEDAGEWFKDSGDWFGDRAGEYAKNLGSTATNIGNILSQGGQDILSSLADDFKNLGNDLESTANKIEKALEDPLGGFLGLGNGFSNLDTLIGNALSDVENTLNNVLGSLENFGNDVKDFFAGIFGRRRKRFARLRQKLRQRMNRDWNIRQQMSRSMNVDRRCVNSCPVCEPLDTDKYTVDEITEAVCGADSVTSRKEAIADLAWLKAQTSYTYYGVNITLIELDYGPTSFSINLDTGSAKFAISYYTTDDLVRRQYGSVLDMSNKVEAGTGMGKEYFPIRWAARNA